MSDFNSPLLKLSKKTLGWAWIIGGRGRVTLVDDEFREIIAGLFVAFTSASFSSACLLSVRFV
jgi:hypothetical protein